jgi:hypothetical protein
VSETMDRQWFRMYHTKDSASIDKADTASDVRGRYFPSSQESSCLFSCRCGVLTLLRLLGIANVAEEHWQLFVCQRPPNVVARWGQ